MRLQNPRAEIDLLAEFRLLPVEAASHIGILGALSRKHEDDGRILTQGTPVAIGKGALSFELRRRFLSIPAQDDAAVFEAAASRLQGMSDVGEALLRMLPQMAGQMGACLPERGLASGRQRQEIGKIVPIC